MSDDSTEPGEKATQIYHRNIRLEGSEPRLALVRTIADLKDVNVRELNQLYGCTGDLVTRIFQVPPPPSANTELTFSYEGFRITIYQDGHTVLQPL